MDKRYDMMELAHISSQKVLVKISGILQDITLVAWNGTLWEHLYRGNLNTINQDPPYPLLPEPVFKYLPADHCVVGRKENEIQSAYKVRKAKDKFCLIQKYACH